MCHGEMGLRRLEQSTTGRCEDARWAVPPKHTKQTLVLRRCSLSASLQMSDIFSFTSELRRHPGIPASASFKSHSNPEYSSTLTTAFSRIFCNSSSTSHVRHNSLEVSDRPKAVRHIFCYVLIMAAPHRKTQELRALGLTSLKPTAAEKPKYHLKSSHFTLLCGSTMAEMQHCSPRVTSN